MLSGLAQPRSHSPSNGSDSSLMRLYFIRHGQSTDNELGDRTGSDIGRSEDAPLTAIGRRQAALLGGFLAAEATYPNPPGMDSKDLKGFQLSHLYCSLMDRAIATATAVSETTGLTLFGLTDVHESGGIYLDEGPEKRPMGRPGRTRSEFEAAYPNLVLPAEVREDGWWNRPMEPKSERPARARRALDLLVERHGDTDDRVALVSHGGFFNWFMMHIIGIADPDAVWLHMNNTAISRIDFYGGLKAVQYINRTDHLPAELIT